MIIFNDNDLYSAILAQKDGEFLTYLDPNDNFRRVAVTSDLTDPANPIFTYTYMDDASTYAGNPNDLLISEPTPTTDNNTATEILVCGMLAEENIYTSDFSRDADGWTGVSYIEPVLGINAIGDNIQRVIGSLNINSEYNLELDFKYLASVRVEVIDSDGTIISNEIFDGANGTVQSLNFITTTSDITISITTLTSTGIVSTALQQVTLNQLEQNFTLSRQTLIDENNIETYVFKKNGLVVVPLSHTEGSCVIPETEQYTDTLGEAHTIENLVNGTPQNLTIEDIKSATIWNRTSGKVFIEMPNGEGAKLDPNDERIFTKSIGLYMGDIIVTPLENNVNLPYPGETTTAIIEIQLEKYI